MGSEEPGPERDELVDRVQRLEERMTQFEQDLRTMHVPIAEPQDTDVTAIPAPSEDPIKKEAELTPMTPAVSLACTPPLHDHVLTRCSMNQ